MFLTAEQLQELTHRQLPSAQIRALRAMGIPHRVRPDGTPAVMRATLEEMFNGYRASREPTAPGPNWSALHK